MDAFLPTDKIAWNQEKWYVLWIPVYNLGLNKVDKDRLKFHLQMLIRNHSLSVFHGWDLFNDAVKYLVRLASIGRTQANLSDFWC